MCFSVALCLRITASECINIEIFSIFMWLIGHIFCLFFLCSALRSDGLFSYRKCHKIAQNPFKTINDRADDHKNIIAVSANRLNAVQHFHDSVSFGFSFIRFTRVCLCVRSVASTLWCGLKCQETHSLWTLWKI